MTKRVITVVLNSCLSCPFYGNRRNRCARKNRSLSIEEIKNIPDWCPFPEHLNELEVNIRHFDKALLLRLQYMISELVDAEIPKDEIRFFSKVTSNDGVPEKEDSK